MSRPRAVTFDFGQTLAELDTAMLSRRLAERGATVEVRRLDAAVPAAWRAYNDAIRAGHGGHPWKVLMATLLTTSGVSGAELDGTVDWLWSEQPKANLWRRPIAGMIELVRALREAHVPVGVVSNSEGRLAELIAELGWTEDLPVVADSGRLGIEKPAPAIFHWAAARLEVSPAEVVHVGDAWAADYEGALAAGMRAVLFRGGASVPLGATDEPADRARRCEEAHEVRAALVAWGLWLPPG